MNFYELLVIYLACGAPFGAYYYFQNKQCPDLLHRWLKTVLIFLFWIPYAANLCASFYFSNKSSILKFDFFQETDSRQTELSNLQRVIEKLIISGKPELPLFEIREIFDRYAGLTAAVSEEYKNREIGSNSEFFKISENNSFETAALCNQRRNFARLSFHQKLASEDFLNLFSDLKNKNELTDQLFSTAVKFLDLLNDEKTRREFENLFAETLQTGQTVSVTDTEVILWKPEQPRSINSTKLSMPFQTMKATTNLSSKD